MPCASIEERSGLCRGVPPGSQVGGASRFAGATAHLACGSSRSLKELAALTKSSSATLRRCSLLCTPGHGAVLGGESPLRAVMIGTVSRRQGRRCDGGLKEAGGKPRPDGQKPDMGSRGEVALQAPWDNHPDTHEGKSGGTGRTPAARCQRHPKDAGESMS